MAKKQYKKPTMEFLAESRKLMTVQLASCGTTCADNTGQCGCNGDTVYG
jgi:hypothetical protein